MESHRRTIDVSEEGQELLTKFNNHLHSLCGMVDEMMDRSPQTILSPVFRTMLMQKAIEVDHLHGTIRNALCVDWPAIPRKAVSDK